MVADTLVVLEWREEWGGVRASMGIGHRRWKLEGPEMEWWSVGGRWGGMACVEWGAMAAAAITGELRRFTLMTFLAILLKDKKVIKTIFGLSCI